MKRWCSIYKLFTKIIINSESELKEGGLIPTDPCIIMKLPVNYLELTENILTALQSSKIGIERPNNWTEFGKIWKVKMTLKNSKDLYEKGSCCSVIFENGLYIITPYKRHYYKNKIYFVGVNSKPIKVNSIEDKESFGRLVIEVLEKDWNDE